jgi:hypothetical protein
MHKSKTFLNFLLRLIKKYEGLAGLDINQYFANRIMLTPYAE